VVGLAKLTRLTSLTLQGHFFNATNALGQLLAEPLPLQQLRLEKCCDDGLQPLNMASLTQLTQFSSDAALDDATVLPAQLQRLYLRHRGSCYHRGLQPVLQLQQLQHLEVTFTQRLFCGRPITMHLPSMRDALTRLALLPALQHVKLEYTVFAQFPMVPQPAQLLAAGTAEAWGQISQLRELKVQFWNVGADTRSIEQIVAGLAAATSLTMLTLQPDWKLARSCDAALTKAVPKLQPLQHLWSCCSAAYAAQSAWQR
jgi:hypothetical protein